MQGSMVVVSTAQEGVEAALLTWLNFYRGGRRQNRCWRLRKMAGEVGTDSWRCSGAQGGIRRCGAARSTTAVAEVDRRR